MLRNRNCYRSLANHISNDFRIQNGPGRALKQTCDVMERAWTGICTSPEQATCRLRWSGPQAAAAILKRLCSLRCLGVHGDKTRHTVKGWSRGARASVGGRVAVLRQVSPYLADPTTPRLGRDRAASGTVQRWRTRAESSAGRQRERGTSGGRQREPGCRDGSAAARQERYQRVGAVGRGRRSAGASERDAAARPVGGGAEPSRRWRRDSPSRDRQMGLRRRAGRGSCMRRALFCPIRPDSPFTHELLLVLAALLCRGTNTVPLLTTLRSQSRRQSTRRLRPGTNSYSAEQHIQHVSPGLLANAIWIGFLWQEFLQDIDVMPRLMYCTSWPNCHFHQRD